MVAAIAALACAVNVAAAQAASPSVAGTWAVTFTSPPCVQGCAQTYTYTETSPGIYTYANGLGWYTTDVPITGSSATVWICGNGGTYSQADEGACPAASGYWIVSETFNLHPAPGRPETAKGTVIQHNPDGTIGTDGGPFTATGPAPEPHRVTITGHVSGSDGKPYDGLKVEAVDDGDETTARTDPEGVFVLRDVESGPVVIRLVSVGCRATVARETVNAQRSITVKYIAPVVIVTRGTSEHLVAIACGVPEREEGFTFETKLIGSRVKNGSCTDAASQDVKRYHPFGREVTATFELPSSSDRFCNGAYHMTVFGDGASGVESAAKRFNIVRGEVLDRETGRDG